MRTRLKTTLTGMLLTMLCASVAPAAAHAEFGIASFEGSVTANEAGAPDRQAGSHPFAITTSFTFNTTSTEESTGALEPDGQVRGIQINLPPGLIGDPAATPRCTQAQLSEASASKCPKITQVGTEHLSFVVNGAGTITHPTVAVYNVVPPRGVPAEFAFRYLTNTIPIFASVRSGGDYGITMSLKNIAQALGLVGSSTTFWGVPASQNEGGGSPTPFLTLPTACRESETMTMHAESWQGVVSSAETKLPAVTGCERVPFTPSLSVAPDTAEADSPAGLSVDLSLPQSENPTGVGEASLDDAEVKLPPGMSVNPGIADGLAACPLEGAEGVNLHAATPAGCSNASKIGTVSIKTPLLEEELTGGVYVAQQGNMPGLGSNPFGSLLAIYVAAEGSGVTIKLAGKIEANPVTGQLTATFDENPELPFSDLKLDLFGGQRAALSTPAACGAYSASAELTPYSSTEAVSVGSRPFTISSGCGGGFSPSFSAGTVNPQAGSSSPFTLTLKRNDAEQHFSTVASTLPPGLVGMIAQVPLCGEAQANADQCPAASQIGHVIAQAGVGNEVVTLPEAGKPQDPVYLTGPYGGGPFGLLIVVPAEAGPFDLGTVTVRAAIHVDPRTGQVSVDSTPLQSILQGIPLDVKAMQVTIDREGFIVNPTSCAPASVTGTIGAVEGASAAVSSRFQAANCAALPFKPSFSATAHAHHSKAGGEYLRVDVGSKAGQANIAKIHVTLPKKLPSRLSTLKLACPAAQFAADPASCPASSFVGTVAAYTPVLPVPLSGPALFVSHGGAGFPNLDFVMQGDGVTIDLVGDTFISKAGITTSTFSSVPDVPISSFELTLPAGPHSALGGNGDLCAAPLYMPTTITGQNGAVLSQRTRIDVAGCKPQIRVVGKRSGRRSATITLTVPAAGKLTVSGADVERHSKRLARAGRAKIAVRLSGRGRRLLARHPGRRLAVAVRLRFQPAKGRAIGARTKVLIG